MNSDGIAEVHSQIKQAFEVVHDEIAAELFYAIDVDVEIVVDADADVDVTMQDCVLHLEQNIPASEAAPPYYVVEVPTESAETLIADVLRKLEE